ncbi:gibberellin 2-beta-dioxygenase 8-like [Olea europaea subsp. europaea]|uniref:Gibberellin 2-beta-dioxygenase 8-like n=1 Tax=Olea europaea subsp. europaea TaxID=158383 RepID=A0A8S0R4A4_OLEEU|nr:gibberellin 2-beta-dioxygenase 8-like [Olea europaea subsp. europaea]
MGEESPDPPFQEKYKNLFDSLTEVELAKSSEELLVDECELPLIDLNMLNLGDSEREACKRQIAKASREWGFFQVVNHGISSQFSMGSYTWGTPSPNYLRQLSWSEAYHVSLSDILGSGGLCTLRSTMEQFAAKVSELAQKLAEILVEKLGQNYSTFFKETCLNMFAKTCFIRMNRYPACQISTQMFGLMARTNSDFLTILHQDHVGGLQLVKDGKWSDTGDIVWSNNVYKSVHHRVAANKLQERFSTAYFLCPSYDTVIQSCVEPSAYRKFSFREYRQQVQNDVKCFGYKVGLARFLL